MTLTISATVGFEPVSRPIRERLSSRQPEDLPAAHEPRCAACNDRKLVQNGMLG